MGPWGIIAEYAGSKASEKAKSSKGWFRSPLFKVALAVLLIGFIGASSTVLYFYVQYSRIIDRKLSGEIFKNTAKIYATPYHIYPGQKLTTDAVVSRLQRAGFENSDKGISTDGAYDVKSNEVTIRPLTRRSTTARFSKRNSDAHRQTQRRH